MHQATDHVPEKNNYPSLLEANQSRYSSYQTSTFCTLTDCITDDRSPSRSGYEVCKFEHQNRALCLQFSDICHPIYDYWFLTPICRVYLRLQQDTACFFTRFDRTLDKDVLNRNLLSGRIRP